MPSQARSLRLTDAYRRRLFALREQVQGAAPGIWDSPDRLATVVEQAQKASLRLTSAYLAAFVASETGKPTRALTIDTRAYSGSTADGQPLAEGMRSPLIGYFAALKSGKSVEEATRIGIDRAKRQVGMNYDHAHRTALMETIASSEHFKGWTRALRGTCTACASKATGVQDGLQFQAHPGCQCVAEPEVGPPPTALNKALSENKPAMQVTGSPSRELDDAVTLAAREIQDQLDLDELPLTLDYKKFRVAGQDGEFARATRSIAVDVRAAPQTATTTYVHEFGHYLDKIFGARSGVITENKARQELVAALGESGSVVRLKALKASFKERIPSPAARKGANKFLNYLMSEDELVARAFEQYMALRRPALRSSFGQNRTAKTITDIDVTIRDNKYWSDEEFAPIANKIDGWLESLGVKV